MHNNKNSNGLDANGFICNEYSLDNIQPEFNSVVNKVIKALIIAFPNQIHSIYLYGSVPRGNAVAGKSDLDLSVIFDRKLVSADYHVMHSIANTANNAHSVVSKVDIDPGEIDTVIRKQEHCHWHFWLKHCCCCVWGNDIAVDFAKHRPCINIARALNGDMESFLEDMEPKFATMQSADVNKVIGKKLLRAAYYCIAEQNDSWHTNILLCYSSALPYYPDCHDDLHMAYKLSQGIDSSREKVIELYNSFSKVIIATMQAEPKNI